MTPLVPHRGRSFLFNLLARTTLSRTRFPYRLFWDRMYAATRHWTTPVATIIHERPVVVSFSYSYPIFCRRFPGLNNPLVELVNQAFVALARPIRFVDVGAAIGDTVLLIDANCPGMVDEYVCIDGDTEFFGYLTRNLAQFRNCRCVFQQLAGKRGEEKSLVRTHGGTASAQGAQTSMTLPLDEVLAAQKIEPVDVLKIDVDGFDGAVLSGAAEMLRRQQPAVIFEWHPILCDQTGNDPFLAFRVLAAAGYRELAWFTKFGAFSHFGRIDDEPAIARLADYCRRTTTQPDWHYDVVALPAGSRIDWQKLADLAYATVRRSPF